MPASTKVRDPHRYQILGEHGRGGLGRVSRAHDVDLGRDIAIKELISRGHVSEVRFLREALITARLEHPGIVPVHEAGRWPDGTPFYAMKLVAGRSLRELIAERATVDERIGLLHHVIAVADAIAYAHGRNIIHRDLKPSNIIVGEFGETVVIDWGLAKDLTATEESTIGGGPFRVTQDDGLTSVGTILGTPAYMAPEQERGESVDQRADVFAIGAMLWELCSLEKLPPSFTGQRRHILRRAGIDPDLATIIEKAVAPDPDHRYPDAGTLAADLKAFKAGARIASRRYSLWALLVHWTRRHSAAALAVLAVLVVTVAGAALYVRNVTTERDRADASEVNAKRDRAAAHASLDELTLQHAELLLATDPSATMDLLATYRGDDTRRAELIRAEAVGLGVARLRVRPHTDRVRWVAGMPNGALVSLATDGTIVQTMQSNDTTLLAKGVSPRGRFTYSATRHLLAYGCDPDNVCIWDVRHSVRFPMSASFQHWQLAGLSFSPEGSRLALLSYSGNIKIFDVRDPAHPIEELAIVRDHAIGILLVDESTVGIGILNTLKLELVGIHTKSRTFTVNDKFLWDTYPHNHQMALATLKGEGILLNSATLAVQQRMSLCPGLPTGLKYRPNNPSIVYSCHEGSIGIWNPADNRITTLAHLDNHVEAIELGQTGDYILAVGSNGMFVVIDLLTRLVTHYRGHGVRVTALAAPTADFPYFLTGDIKGAIRAWPIPLRVGHVAAEEGTRLVSAIFTRANSEVIATTFRPQLTRLSLSGKIHYLEPHLDNATNLQLANSGRVFAAYGPLASVELWDAQTLTLQRAIQTGQGAISRVVFVGQDDDLVTAGRDGRLIYWPSSGNERVLTKLDAGITDFAIAPDGSVAVLSATDDTLWRITLDGQATRLSQRHPTIRLQRIGTSMNVGIVSRNGDLAILDMVSGAQTSIFHSPHMIRDVAFANDGHTISVIDDDGTTYLGHFSGSGLNLADWTSFRIHATRVMLADNGMAVVLCNDGTVWIYAESSRHWVCLPLGATDLTMVALNSDSTSAAVIDSDGRIVLIDLERLDQPIN